MYRLEIHTDFELLEGESGTLPDCLREMHRTAERYDRYTTLYVIDDRTDTVVESTTGVYGYDEYDSETCDGDMPARGAMRTPHPSRYTGTPMLRIIRADSSG